MMVKQSTEAEKVKTALPLLDPGILSFYQHSIVVNLFYNSIRNKLKSPGKNYSTQLLWHT